MRRTAAAGCVTLALLLGASGCGGDQRRDTTPKQDTQAPVPGPIIGGHRARVSPLSTAERAAATRAAREFLTGYLPYLYGRARPGSVRPISRAVARSLRTSHARVTPAQQQRRPRATALDVTGQSARSAIAAAVIADGGPAPYRLSFTLERLDGRWLIVALGND